MLVPTLCAHCRMQLFRYFSNNILTGLSFVVAATFWDSGICLCEVQAFLVLMKNSVWPRTLAMTEDCHLCAFASNGCHTGSIPEPRPRISWKKVLVYLGTASFASMSSHCWRCFFTESGFLCFCLIFSLSTSATCQTHSPCPFLWQSQALLVCSRVLWYTLIINFMVY